MTGPRSGSRPHRVDDPAAARLLLDEATRAVFGCFLGHDRSVREAADLLGRDLDAVLYRVKRLLSAGLLEVVAVVPRGGRAVRRYRAPHDAWFVPFEVLPYADLEETFAALHRANGARAARAAARWLARSPWAGYVVERGDDGQVWLRGSGSVADAGGGGFVAPGGDPTGPLDATLDLRLSDVDAAALNAELADLVARYASLGRVAEGAAANRMLQVVSVPLGPDDRA
jgi:hypothetical protein